MPVIRWGEYYNNEDETFIYDELSEEVQKIIDNYILLFYDIIAGEQYSIELGMFNYVE